MYSFDHGKKMACSLKRRCRRTLKKKSCWCCIFIIAVILILSYIGNQNHGNVLSDSVSERWSKERLHMVIQPELETTILQPKLRHNSICLKDITPDTLLHEEPFQILILVTSAPSNVEARSAIRNTWANESLLPPEVEVFFILGTTQDENVEEIVKKEAEQFNDIIMEDFIDSYDNLTYKTLFALKWATRNCFKVTHLMKTDDDMLIIPTNLILHSIMVRDFLLRASEKHRNLVLFREKQMKLNKINHLSEEIPLEEIICKINETNNTSNIRSDYLCMPEEATTIDEDKIESTSGGYILGKILRRVRPYRDRNSKWYIPSTLYYDKYLPDFASGTAYVIINGNKHCGAIKSLFINALKIMPALPLEDVFITGVVGERINLLLIQDDKQVFSSSIPVLFPWTLSRHATCYYRDKVAVHGFKPNDLITAWNKLQDITADECSSIFGIIQSSIYALIAIFEMPNG